MPNPVLGPLPPLPLPRVLGDHPACGYCGRQLTDADVALLEFRGLLQVIAGRDALEITDVTYQCPCGGTLHTRFRTS